MQYSNESRPPNEPADVVAPTECPACRSKNVVTASKVVTDASYWRCESCSEVWNAGRRAAARHYQSARSTWR